MARHSQGYGWPRVSDPNPDYSEHLRLTNTSSAHAAGFTGEGVSIGIDKAAGASEKLAEGRSVVFGIRPEHIMVGDGGSSLRGKVVVMEPTGADTQVLCRVGHSDIIVVSHDRISAHAGDDISLQPDLAHAHIFDAGTGQSLRQ